MHSQIIHQQFDYLEFFLEKASDSLSDSDPQRDSYKTNLNLFDNAFTRCYRKIPWSRWDLDVVVWSDGGPGRKCFFPALPQIDTDPAGSKEEVPSQFPEASPVGYFC